MKNKFNREGYATIKGGFEGQGASLEFEIPVRLIEDFSNCFNTKEGEQTLSDLYDEYISMSVKQKEIFQMSIYDNEENILNTRDIVTMIRALKTVFCGW